MNMKKFLSLLVTVLLLMRLCNAQVSVINLRCEDRVNPMGLDILNPRFSWQLLSDQRDLEQTAYEMRVGKKSGKDILWNSGKIADSQSLFVPYTGNTLESGTAYFWQVRVWDNKGRVSDWSEKAYWQMGLSATFRLEGKMD